MKKTLLFFISIMVFFTITGCQAKESSIKTHTDIIMENTSIEDTFFGYQYFVEKKKEDGTSSIQKKYMWQSNTKFVFIEEGEKSYAVVTEATDIMDWSAIIHIQRNRLNYSK